ncbi:SsrA-binding protein SmpB [Patescibacteria group bacterium]
MIINKRAKYDYEILETYEAGLVLSGFEVKAVRQGKMNLKGSYVTLKNEGNSISAYLLNAHISPYQPANTPDDYNPTRLRRLLLKKKELNSLVGKTKQKGLTLIPICVYNKRKRIKLEFAIGKGKKKIDKREAIKKRDIDREIRGDFRL